MRDLDCVIIGAGPAGLFCGASIAPDKKVLIIEKNTSAGKKLLLSGNGRCNVTHAGSREAFLKAYREAGHFMKFAISAFPNKALMGFLEKQGVSVTEREDGKIFPASMKASHVLEALLKACGRHGLTIKYNEPVTSVSKNGGLFAVFTEKGAYRSEKLVIATGGMSFPETGSSGEGLELAKALGLSVVKAVPALTPLFIEGYAFSDIAGLSIEARCRIERNGRLIAKNTGIVLFTHRGLSGPGILDMSRYGEAGDVLSLSFTDAAGIGGENFHKLLISEAAETGSKTAKGFVKRLGIPEALTEKILRMSGIPPLLHVGEVSKRQRRLLAANLFSMKLKISSKGGFDTAMATAGGVDLKELNPKTMASKAVPGLFVIGEALNVDGISGGYNIQGAFSTGFLAARAVSGHGRK